MSAPGASEAATGAVTGRRSETVTGAASGAVTGVTAEAAGAMR
ncbi:hypothetical protein AB0L68_32850 [Streptomyces sp. NPDC052164]